MTEYSKMPEPHVGDLIAFDGFFRPADRTYRIEEIRGYYPGGEGWGVVVVNNDDPSERHSLALHEDYDGDHWWRYVR